MRSMPLWEVPSPLFTVILFLKQFQSRENMRAFTAHIIERGKKKEAADILEDTLSICG